jgi:hypothetical protein
MSTSKISFPGIDGARERPEKNRSDATTLQTILKQCKSQERVAAAGKVASSSSRNQIVFMYSANTQQVTPTEAERAGGGAYVDHEWNSQVFDTLIG